MACPKFGRGLSGFKVATGLDRKWRMSSFVGVASRVIRKLALGLMFLATAAAAQQGSTRPREFIPGRLSQLEEIPASRLRTRLDGLPAAARGRALQTLRNFHFTELDLNSLETDSEGGVFYVDMFPPTPADAKVDGAAALGSAEPVVAPAAVPVSPFPASLVFHSKPGAANVIYLNFAGEIVTNTAWNASLSRTQIPAVAFSTDADFTSFSDAEQTAIKSAWLRVAEDYAPFNVDVTTERPATLGATVAMALITRNTDADTNANPSSAAGGVAYVSVFGNGNYAYYRPAWIYYNNLGNNESYIAEAASHELGHNLGLSHDGKTDGTEYYGGHGTGDISWGPIMGTGYGRSVSEWSKGDYYLANNTQDDLATIATRIPYQTDDHGDTPAAATPLVITGGTNIVSTRPDTDPSNLSPANKGILERTTDVDVFSFSTGNGPVNLTVNPWTMPSGTRGGNVDLLLELRDAAGSLIVTNNPSSQTLAQIQTTLSVGKYYLHIRNTGTGDPLVSAPTGYTVYGSLGQYFISGYLSPSPAAPAPPSNLRIVFN
jgi:hypothetical protein